MDTDQYINKLFLDAGWHPGREFRVKTKISYSFNTAYTNAVKVLSEYGGLKVGEAGPGRELSASDIRFNTETFDFGSEFHNYWVNLNTQLFAVASAHRDHMLLLVDNSNNFYIFTEPDEQLYFIGGFKETVERVLLGINYGVPLEKA